MERDCHTAEHGYISYQYILRIKQASLDEEIESPEKIFIKYDMNGYLNTYMRIHYLTFCYLKKLKEIGDFWKLTIEIQEYLESAAKKGYDGIAGIDNIRSFIDHFKNPQ